MFQLPLPGESNFRFLTVNIGPSPVAPAGGIHFQNSDFEIMSVCLIRTCSAVRFNRFYSIHGPQTAGSNLYCEPALPVRRFDLL